MVRLFESRLANITMSFSWVFMIIVGTLFIVLAYNIIGKYQDNENAKYDIELRQAIRNILNKYGRTAGMEENALAPIGNMFQDSEVEILCEGGLPLLSINGKIDSGNDYLKLYPTFMTYIDEGKNENVYMAIESFRMPFKITNMLALVSKRNLIVFDKDSQIGEDMLSKFKKGSYRELNYIPYDFESFDYNGFYSSYVKGKNLNSVMFVTDEGSSVVVDVKNDLSSFRLDEVYLLEVSDNFDGTGVLKYTDKEGENYSFNYLDYEDSLSLQTMAVFSRPSTFNCSYNLLIDSINPVYDFYIKKANYFSNLTTKICVDDITVDEQSYHYNEMRDVLLNMTDEVENDKFKKIDDVKFILDTLNFQHLHLEDLSCQYIY